MVVEALDVVVVNGHESIVGFSKPEENYFAGTDVAVASRIAGKGSCLKIFHVYVRERAAGGFTHAESFHLFVEVFTPPEVGEVEIEFNQRHDVVNPDRCALAEVSVVFQFLFD